MAEEKKTTAAKLQFHYLKGPDYREVSCTGVLGGQTPPGKLWMAFFNERPSIPRIVEYTLESTGGGQINFDEANSKPTRVEARPGLVRHVEFSCYMDLETAKKIHVWLGNNIEAMSKRADK